MICQGASSAAGAGRLCIHGESHGECFRISRNIFHGSSAGRYYVIVIILLFGAAVEFPNQLGVESHPFPYMISGK